MPVQNGTLRNRMTTLLLKISVLNALKCANGRVATLSSSCAAAFKPTPVKINTQVIQLIAATP